MARIVLFLCTGNYYRSRFAETLFNDLVLRAGLDWAATSRALALERGASNVGPISPDARRELQRRGISLPEPVRFPVQCCDQDLRSADLVVALKETEHRPLLAERFPDWRDRVEYWHVHDLDAWGSDQALGEIARRVSALIDSLQNDATSQPRGPRSGAASR